MTAAAEALVLAHLHLVAPIARALRQILPYTIDREDLEAQGRLGLVQAANSYDPRRSSRVPFSLWARYKIRGAILDAHKGRNYKWEQRLPLLNFEFYPARTRDEVARPNPRREWYRDLGPGPEPAILHMERKALVARAAARVLTSRERATLERVARGWRMAAIGRQMHVTESAVCRIRDRAIAKVKAHLGGIVDHGRGAGASVTGP